jgi:hypothetical protein
MTSTTIHMIGSPTSSPEKSAHRNKYGQLLSSNDHGLFLRAGGK